MYFVGSISLDKYDLNSILNHILVYSYCVPLSEVYIPPTSIRRQQNSAVAAIKLSNEIEGSRYSLFAGSLFALRR